MQVSCGCVGLCSWCSGLIKNQFCFPNFRPLEIGFEWDKLILGQREKNRDICKYLLSVKEQPVCNMFFTLILGYCFKKTECHLNQERQLCIQQCIVMKDLIGPLDMHRPMFMPW